MRNKFLGMLLVMIMFIGCGMPNKVKMDDPNMGWEENETIGAFQTYKGKPYTGTLLKEEGYVELKDGIYHGNAKYTDLDPDGKTVIDGIYDKGVLVDGTSEYYMKNMRGEWVLRNKSVFVDDPVHGKVLEECEYYNEINNSAKALANPTKIVRYQMNKNNEKSFILNGRYIDSKFVGEYNGQIISLGLNGYLIGGKFFGYTVLSMNEFVYRVDFVINQSIWDLTLLYLDHVTFETTVSPFAPAPNPVPKFEQHIANRFVKNLYSAHIYNRNSKFKLSYFNENALKELSKKKIGVYIDPTELANAESQLMDNGFKKYPFTGILNHKDYSNKSQYTEGVSFQNVPSGDRVYFWTAPTLDDYNQRKAKKQDDPRYQIEVAFGNQQMEDLINSVKKYPELWTATFEDENYGFVGDYDKEPDFNEKESYYVMQFEQDWSGNSTVQVNRRLFEGGDDITIPIFRLNNELNKVYKYHIEQKKWIQMKDNDPMMISFHTLYGIAVNDILEYHKMTQINMYDIYHTNVATFISEYKEYLKDKEIK